MRIKGIIPLAIMARAALMTGQAQVYCARVIGHTPFYERILIPRGNLLRPDTLRGADDLEPGEMYSATNRIDRIFEDPTRERSNGFFASCLAEVPVTSLSLRCPGDLLTSEQVAELLRDTVVVPRTSWTNHNTAHGGHWRYVFSLETSKKESFVIDERPGACALVYFPDGTYRCVMNPNYSCLKPLQIAPTDGGQPIRPETNRTSSAAGPHR